MSRFFQKLLLGSLVTLTLAACQTLAERPNAVKARELAASLPTNCSVDIETFRQQVTEEGAVDAGSPAMTLAPWLHSTRYLNTLSEAVDTDLQLIEWTTLLVELGVQTRAGENSNLQSPWPEATLASLAECAELFASSPNYREQRSMVLNEVRESDPISSYIQLRQGLGALPLLRPFLGPRILAEHARERELFLTENGFERSTVYSPEEAAPGNSDADIWLQRSYNNSPLSLPRLTESQLDVLFAAHAPTLNIELQEDNDRVGKPHWHGGEIAIDSERPAVYTLPSMTRFEGRNLLQLNYAFWFPERRARGPVDLYAGAIDGIIWRVTLDEKGDVLLYDSIHSCGCYHKYFLVSEDILPRAQPTSREPANIFSLDDSLQQRLTLHITANEHYIAGIEGKDVPKTTPEDSMSYDLLDYASLKILPVQDGRRSLFDAHGLIRGSERLERFTLWPTGIRSVGAMRQWGTHATGFLEEQHFDDGRLFEHYFESLSPTPSSGN